MMAEIVITMANLNDTVVVEYPSEAQIAVVQKPAQTEKGFATVGIKFVGSEHLRSYVICAKECG